MKIVVDGDGCPGKLLIEKAAKEEKIEVVIFCDINHYITSEYSTIKCVDAGFQSVDMYVMNETKKNDIVVTQDFGVAAMVLGKKAFAIGPKGYVFDEGNIDKLLFERHISQKVRRSGGKTSSPSKRTSEDDDRLYRNLKKLIIKAKELEV
ncbi:hypothetical protein SAMN02745163_02376 [Clostridium cavendishii DSM 21758]|uniref:UPF0178 protein SAMN02745163_02376 n=1 Tax=Clostridium cavendishii DSM 21758 TaxID=1121302 RepID=A0A1M6LGL1_9CLOT|nr:YaiI/YqxD family protein [Clostridium cavendishii]SHJ70351.1 hypothetical protein SAMN02745163_02376 [Clostridium cavendishii DSM 21758]